jgi:hypothetical protein
VASLVASAASLVAAAAAAVAERPGGVEFSDLDAAVRAG